MKRVMLRVAWIVAAAFVSSCGRELMKPLSCDEYVALQYKYMPLPDSLVYPKVFWEEAVEKTLEVREKMAWGIPEREFRHFVLPLRVNNEDLDNFRVLYADELCERVAGMSLEDAILEINHWCHERVTYTPTDARTRGPIALMATGKGRCGEESTFTVSALRAAGIPARQVYTPRWAHTDDNHAWVEAWVDGKWHFLGACEPEPKLDMGWFNASVSRAMLLHTRVSGDYQGDEDVIIKNPVFTEINVIRGYVPARKSIVTVCHEDGSPAVGVEVEFKIFNYQEFCTVCKTRTDAEGNTSLYTGLGDMMAWAADNGKFGYVKVSDESTVLVLNHSSGDVISEDINIIPPVENPLPSPATEDEIRKNSQRLAYENSIRNAAHTEPAGKAVLDAFDEYVKGDALKEKAAKTVLESLFPKDLDEVGLDVLKDAVSSDCAAGSYVLCPRISFEMLYPFRAEIREGLVSSIHSPEEAFAWVKDNITVISQDRNPQKLRIPPVFVWRSRISDAPSLRIFYVAVCRSLGFPARLDLSTGKAQFLKGEEWMDVDFEQTVPELARKGEARLAYEGKEPQYFYDYTISKIEDGRTALLDFEYYDPRSEDGGLKLDEGYYLITTGKRLPDGSVLAHIGTFNVAPDKVNEVSVVIRSEEEMPLDIIGRMDVSDISDKAAFVLAVVKKNGEPTIHALRQLEGDENAVIIGPDDSRYSAVKARVEQQIGADSKNLPYVLVLDAGGNVYYMSQGYNTSLRISIDRVMKLVLTSKQGV